MHVPSSTGSVWWFHQELGEARGKADVTLESDRCRWVQRGLFSKRASEFRWSAVNQIAFLDWRTVVGWKTGEWLEHMAVIDVPSKSFSDEFLSLARGALPGASVPPTQDPLLNRLFEVKAATGSVDSAIKEYGLATPGGWRSVPAQRKSKEWTAWWRAETLGESNELWVPLYLVQPSLFPLPQ